MLHASMQKGAGARGPLGGPPARPSIALAVVWLQLFLVCAIYLIHEAVQVRSSAVQPAEATPLLGPSSGSIASARCPPAVHLDDVSMSSLRDQVTAAMGALIRAGPAVTKVDETSSLPAQALQFTGASPLVDELYGPNSENNIPGVEDIHQELQGYLQTMLSGFTTDPNHAAARQQRPSAASLGLRAVDPMDDATSIPTRVAFLNDLAAETSSREEVRVALAAITAVDLMGVRREVLPWLQYHTALGVTKFYLLYDGSDAAAVAVLAKVSCVELMHLHQPWATTEEAAAFQAYRNLTAMWSGQSGNYELMFKQGECAMLA